MQQPRIKLQSPRRAPRHNSNNRIQSEKRKQNSVLARHRTFPSDTNEEAPISPTSNKISIFVATKNENLIKNKEEQEEVEGECKKILDIGDVGTSLRKKSLSDLIEEQDQQEEEQKSE